MGYDVMYVGKYVPTPYKNFLLPTSGSFENRNPQLNKFCIRLDVIP